MREEQERKKLVTNKILLTIELVKEKCNSLGDALLVTNVAAEYAICSQEGSISDPFSSYRSSYDDTVNKEATPGL